MAKRKKADDDQEQGRSVKWMVGALMITIAFIGWGAMASAYEAHMQPLLDVDGPDGPLIAPRFGRGRGGVLIVMFAIMVLDFIINAFVQLPNLFSVISWNFQSNIGVPIGIAVCEVGALAVGLFVKSMEGHADDPYKKLRDNRKAELTGPAAPEKRKKKRRRR